MQKSIENLGTSKTKSPSKLQLIKSRSFSKLRSIKSEMSIENGIPSKAEAGFKTISKNRLNKGFVGIWQKDAISKISFGCYDLNGVLYIF